MEASNKTQGIRLPSSPNLNCHCCSVYLTEAILTPPLEERVVPPALTEAILTPHPPLEERVVPPALTEAILTPHPPSGETVGPPEPKEILMEVGEPEKRDPSLPTNPPLAASPTLPPSPPFSPSNSPGYAPTSPPIKDKAQGSEPDQSSDTPSPSTEVKVQEPEHGQSVQVSRSIYLDDGVREMEDSKPKATPAAPRRLTMVRPHPFSHHVSDDVDGFIMQTFPGYFASLVRRRLGMTVRLQWSPC